MVYTCKICKFTHSCRCGGKKCKCGMWLWEAKVADRLVSTYNIEDTQKLIELIKWKNSEQNILSKLGVDSTKEVVAKYIDTPSTVTTILDNKFARTIWMKWVYCEYTSFNADAECIFCWRKRRDWYRMPCLYYLAKQTEQWLVVKPA